MLGMNDAVLKVARPGLSALSADDKDLAFSSDWATPKIFMQTNSDWTNTLGYIPSFMAFRQLNSTNYSHDTLFDIGDAANGVYFSDFTQNLGVSSRTGDTDMWALLYLDPVDGTVPSTYNLEKGEFLLVAKEEGAKTNFPTNNAIDSRFDTFKIFKTGTLTITMPAETITHGNSKSYTETVTHDLGYAPVYLPAAGMDWYMGLSGLGGNSFNVNDKLGFLVNPYVAYSDYYRLDVYVDSSKLYMKYTRSADGVGDESFSACTVTMYYTIFYNKIGESFNYLNEDYQ